MSICWGIAWGMAVSRGRSWCGNWCMACSRCIDQCPQSALSRQLRARPALAGAAGGVDA